MKYVKYTNENQDVLYCFSISSHKYKYQLQCCWLNCLFFFASFASMLLLCPFLSIQTNYSFLINIFVSTKISYIIGTLFPLLIGLGPFTLLFRGPFLKDGSGPSQDLYVILEDKVRCLLFLMIYVDISIYTWPIMSTYKRRLSSGPFLRLGFAPFARVSRGL